MTEQQRRVARVFVDTPLSHLDRAFDYAVPDDLADAVVAGCRVRVRFAGRLVDGYVLELADDSDHEGKLAPIAKVVSSEPVLTPEVAALARALADRYAGTVADVLRLAIPPRHARAEARPAGEPAPEPPPIGEATWHVYIHGASYVQTLGAGESPRAVLNALPRHEPERAIAEAVSATVRSGRGAVVCVPDVRDVERWDRAFTEALGPDVHVVLTAADKPAARYRNFLRVARGEVSVVLGTRGAAYAPVRDLGLVAIWDDGDDLHAEPRAPYPHTREVLLTRAVQARAGVLIAGHARTAEAQSLVDQQWCAEIVADQPSRRREWPVVDVTDGSEHGAAPARLPTAVFETIRAAEGPVLIQVPRRGYRTSLACAQCRTPTACPACQGPLLQHRADAPLVCRWCATTVDRWRCGECGGTRLRAPVVGQLRTAEEFGAAFPNRTIVTSGGDTVLGEIERERSPLVLATPGAEPHVDHGYDVVVLLDTWLMLGRDDVRVVEESHRRWFNALALAGFGARAVAVGDSGTLQALVRADPAGLASRELADRAQTHLPPVGRLATVEGPEPVITSLASREWPPFVDVLGPVPVEPGRDRLILRVPRREGLALARVLKTIAAERSAAKEPPVRIQIDPVAF